MSAVPKEKEIEKHFPMINHIIFKHFRSALKHIEYDDLFQVGSMALLRSIRRFDPNVNTKFSTYAYRSISSEIRNHVHRTSGPIHISILVKTIMHKIKKNCLENLSPEEVATKLGCTVRTANHALRLTKTKVLSLNQKIYQHDSTAVNIEDIVRDETDFSRVEVKDFIDRLPETEKKVLQMRLKGLKQTEIAKLSGYSQVHISRILKSIQRKYNSERR